MHTEKVMKRDKIADTLHGMLDLGMDILKKEELDAADLPKLRALKTLGSIANTAAMMVQLEVTQDRHILLEQRLKQLGFKKPKEIEDKQ